MKQEHWNQSLNHLDPALVDEYILQKSQAALGKSKKRLWLRITAIAACMGALITVAVLTLLLQDRAPTPIVPPTTDTAEPSDSNTTNHVTETESTVNDTPQDTPLIHPEKLSGWPSEDVIGSAASLESTDADPPYFHFESTGVVVKVSIAEIYPDIYYKLNDVSSRRAPSYRLIQFNTLQTIAGENVPQQFLYMLPSHLFVDLSPYDTFILSMNQVGAEGHILRNGTLQQLEALSLPLFASCAAEPELGNVIAYTDGVFNEGLWQNPSWIYGYQFARFHLENPASDPYQVVYRGYTEEDTIRAIRQEIEDARHYTPPVVISLNMTAPEALAALTYVKPFENGVFAQELRVLYHATPTVVYRRFINGCQTEETITINLDTEEVTYSEVRYTEEDLRQIQDLPLYISDLAAGYAAQTPTPPHTDLDGKELYYLNVYGWYVKANDTVYGVIKTSWRYCKLAEDGTRDYFTQYYDDAYLLFDPGADAPRSIDRDELIALVGTRNIYRGEYNVSIEMPQ